jgi:hypothetical protein
MPEADPAERVVDGRECGDDAQATLERRLQLGKRDIRGRLDQRAQVGLMRFEARAAMAAGAARGDAAGRPHPLHQLDRGRGADGEAPRGPPNRATLLDRAHDAQPQIQRHRCRHGDISACLNRYCRITGTDSTQ